MKTMSIEERLDSSRPAKRSSRELHPVFRDVALTAMTVVLVSVAALVAISLIGRFMDADSVAEYLLVRRVSAWLLSGLLLGLGVGLPRYVAHAFKNPRTQHTYLWVALVFGVGSTTIAGLLLNAMAPRAATL